MKKIITCIPLPPPYGGITNWFNILQEEAKKNGFSFININTSPGKTIAGRSIFYRIFIQGFRMLRQSAELINIIKNNKEVHVAHITTSGQLALIRDILFLAIFNVHKIKTVYHLHFGRIPQIFEKRGIEYKLFLKALSLSSKVIVIDLRTYQTLYNRYEEGKICYIPNPIKKFSYNTEVEKNTVIFVGNVLKAKGVEELLEVWEKVVELHPDWNLTIAGFCEETYKKYLESKYSFKNVIMEGYVAHDEILRKISEAVFLVLPSYTEGFPNVVIEAMMCGKAVIGTDVGAISDILSGECGIIIQPQNTKELEESIIRLINDKKLRMTMGKNGKEKALEHYSSNVVFKKYANLWCLCGAKNV